MAKAKVVENLHAHGSVEENAQVIVRTRMDEMYAWEEYVDNPYNVHELHNLRIAAKRLRYSLEIFQGVFPEQAAEIIKEVEQIQEELGSLHDKDVMIALIRLCLGGQDSGSGYEYALMSAPQKSGKLQFAIQPELVAQLLDPEAAPSAEQRQGLEFLLESLQHQREEMYTAFRQHWYQLKGKDFRQQVLSMLKI
ncbi:MAG TPA: CHAD domain-containing protein [Dictyobacter sp.]|nr:CHAD domain-containing protein [Dictyobacter sp.]